MKKLISLFLAISMLFSVLTLITACSTEPDPEAASKVFEELMNLSKSGLEEYEKEVDSATHDDVDRLKEEGQDLIDSLDEVDKAISDEGTDLTEEGKTTILNDVNEMRDRLNAAMAKLDTNWKIEVHDSMNFVLTV